MSCENCEKVYQDGCVAAFNKVLDIISVETKYLKTHLRYDGSYADRRDVLYDLQCLIVAEMAV